MRRIRAVTAFASVVLRVLLRDRQALFFIVVLPVVVITIVGTTFGGQGRIRVGVMIEAHGPIADQLDSAFSATPGVHVTHFSGRDAMATAVRHNEIAAGLVVPAGLDPDVRGGKVVTLEVFGDTSNDTWFTARSALDGEVQRIGADWGAALFVAGRTGTDVTTAHATAAASATGVSVERRSVGAAKVGDISKFARTAPQNLVLFVFVNAMASAAFLVKTRRAGTMRRALSTRSGTGTLMAGIGLGWLAVALVQSVLIIAVGALAFGVNWGDPIAAVTLAVVFASVGSAAGLLVGALGENEDRVGAMTPIIGIVFGALGGCMVPLEVFPNSMRVIAHFTPHYWAITAWERLIFDKASIGDIAGDLAVLMALAAVGTTLAMVRLRQKLTRA